MNMRHDESSRCPTVLVDDDPAARDTFGTHQPIVDAVYELITSEAGGRTIGLEGSWGSGKSTVVRILTERLNGPGSMVTVFDAWAHEGDPLRRSFLDKLIVDLTSKVWVNKKDWSERREELARRRHVEKTRPVPKLERAAIIAGAGAALFAIVLSVCAVLLEVGLNDEAMFPSWPGITLATVLFAAVTSVMLFLFHRSRSGNASDEWLTLFSVQSVTETTSERIETPDPTSIEFESTFRELMRQALGGEVQRRLVLVVDNLDRVAPQDARTIWATLQTFLHHSQDDKEDWIDSLWVVLPYDRAGLADLWAEASSNPPDSRSTVISVADSFLDKSIQARFEVPLPLLSDWRSYLEAVLRSALPECQEVSHYQAYRLFAHKLASEGGRAPSPREVKQYANRVGALHRRWQHELPFSTIAYYASKSYSGVEVAHRLRIGELPEPEVANLLDEDAASQLAAVAFNTEPQHARQLLLGPLIDRAIASDTGDELLVLVDRRGFWDVLLQSSIVQPGQEVSILLTAAARLLEIPVPQRPDAEWAEVISVLASQARTVQEWPALTRRLGTELFGLLSIVHQSTAKEMAVRIADRSIPAGNATPWAAGAHALLSQFEWLEVSASGEPNDICGALAKLADLEGWSEFAGRLRVDATARDPLDSAIIDRIREAPGEASSALDVLHVLEPELDLEPFLEDAEEQIRKRVPSQGQGSETTSNESQGLLSILREGGSAAETRRADLVRDRIALEYIGLANEQGDQWALGDWLYEEMRQVPAGRTERARLSPYAGLGRNLVEDLLNNEEPSCLIPLAQAIERAEDFEIIESIGGSTRGAKLASTLVAQLWESESFAAAMDGNRFRSLWPYVAIARESDALGDDAVIGFIPEGSAFVTEVTTEALSIDHLEMYQIVMVSHPSPVEARRLAEWTAQSLSALTVKRWAQAIEESEDWVKLLASIRDAGPEVTIGGTYAQALSKLLERVAMQDGIVITPLEISHWEKTVVPLIAPPIRGAYREGAVRAAVKAGGNLSETFLDLVGATLREPEIFLRSEILDGLIPNLVAERNRVGLSWLSDALKSGDVRNGAPEGAFDGLREVVQSSLGQDPEDDDRLAEIASLIDPDA